MKTIVEEKILMVILCKIVALCSGFIVNLLFFDWFSDFERCRRVRDFNRFQVGNNVCFVSFNAESVSF